MLIKTIHLLLLFTCLRKTNAKMDEISTNTQLFQKIHVQMKDYKEEILQTLKIARDDIVKELKIIRAQINQSPQKENFEELKSKIEKLATSDSLNQLTTIVTTEAAATQNLAHSCIENQEAFGSILRKNLTTLASRNDLEILSTVARNYSMALEENISEVQHTVGNISNTLNSIESSVAVFNHSLENTVVHLKSIKMAVDKEHENTENIQSIINSNISNLTSSVDEISIQIEKLSNQNNIEQLYDRIANISATEVQFLGGLEVSMLKYFNSTSLNKQLSELPSNKDIAELVKLNENRIVSLNENIKSISSTINVTESFIEEIEDNVKSFNGIFNHSLNILTSVSNSINITNGLLSKVEVDINAIKFNSDFIPTVVMPKLRNLSLVVNELDSQNKTMSLTNVIDQVTDNMNSIISKEIKQLKDVQNNISKIGNSKVISNAMSSLLSKVNDLANESRNDTTMVNKGILSLKSVFDDLMGKFDNFELTVDNVQSGVQNIQGSITTPNSKVAVTNDKFKRIESAINTLNGTLSSVMSVVKIFDTDRDSCTSKMSLVQNKLDQVHLDMDLVGDGIVSVNASIGTVDKKLTIVAELVSPLENKFAKFGVNMEKRNVQINKITDTVTLIRSKLDVLDNISKTEDSVYKNLLNVETTIEDIKENAGNITSFTSEIDDGISNVEDSIHSLSTAVQNIQKTALSIATTIIQIKSYTEPCLPPYASLGSQCIIVFEIKKTWHDAWAHCANLGLAFLEIKQNSLHPITNYLSVRYKDGYHIWIGGSDFAKEGSFIWTSGKAVDKSWGWGIGQPNDWGEGEDCIELCSIHDERMNDIDCNEIYYFACEKI